MANTSPTASQIRTANANAVGGGRKRCQKGKNCSAACINAEMVCLVDLPEPVAVSLSSIRDYINSAKTHMVGGVDEQGNQVSGHFQLLRTPKEAAEWLLAHREELATWGIDEHKLQSVIKYHPEVITVGVEPGVGRNNGKAVVPQLFPESANIPAVIPNKRGGEPVGEKGSFHDQMTKVNEYKLSLETSQYLAKVGPEVFGKTYTDRVGHLVGSGFNADKFIKDLEESGNLGNGIYRAGGLGSIKDSTKRQWDQGLRDVALHFGVPFGTTTSGLNPSGLWKPSENYDQFGDIFKAAKMEDKAGPFAKQSTWIPYAGKTVRDKFDKIFEEAKPGLVMITQGSNRDLTEAILSSARSSKVSEFSFESQFKNGERAAPVKATFVIKDYSDGTRGVVVSTNHIGSGWTGQQTSVRPLILQTAKFMRETGKAPSESEMDTIRRETLKVPGTRPVTAVTRLENPGDRIRQEKGDKVMKDLAKEGKDEKRELAKQEKIVSRIEKEADKLINEIRRGKGEARPNSTKPKNPVPTKTTPPVAGGGVERLVNLPNGKFGANDVWAAVDDYKPNMPKGQWQNKLREIRREVNRDMGGNVVQGPRADEFRRRAQEAGLLPKSTPSKTLDSTPMVSPAPLPPPKKVLGGRDVSDSQLLSLYQVLGKGKNPTQAIQEVARQLRIPESEVKARLQPSKLG